MGHRPSCVPVVLRYTIYEATQPVHTRIPRARNHPPDQLSHGTPSSAVERRHVGRVVQGVCGVDDRDWLEAGGGHRRPRFQGG
eukprot:4522597-Prymnesium_polylepis.1